MVPYRGRLARRMANFIFISLSLMKDVVTAMDMTSG
jgi:hypothetical protein